jgi:hypothetical protein
MAARIHRDNCRNLSIRMTGTCGIKIGACRHLQWRGVQFLSCHTALEEQVGILAGRNELWQSREEVMEDMLAPYRTWNPSRWVSVSLTRPLHIVVSVRAQRRRLWSGERSGYPPPSNRRDGPLSHCSRLKATTPMFLGSGCTAWLAIKRWPCSLFTGCRHEAVHRT